MMFHKIKKNQKKKGGKKQKKNYICHSHMWRIGDSGLKWRALWTKLLMDCDAHVDELNRVDKGSSD